MTRKDWSNKFPMILESIRTGHDTIKTISQDIGMNPTNVGNNLNIMQSRGEVIKYIPSTQGAVYPFHYRIADEGQQ